VRESRGLERLWFAPGPAAGAARLALTPLAWLYAGAVAVRGALYDSGVFPTRVPALPAVSVGNLTVGGTGKTPVAAWLAAELAGRGAHPAIVLRGYGEDEPLVHRQLNPQVPVIVAPDRLAGIARAAAAGADLAVLDDAFQHRRAARVADVVLVSADRWTSHQRLLPAGPWREPLRSLRRASLVIITRKARTAAEAEALSAALGRVAPGVARAVVHLAPGALERVGEGGEGGEGAREEETAPITSLTGERVLAVSAIGDPGAFVAQLAALGAIVDAEVFPDHHRYTAADVARLVRRAADGVGEKPGEKESGRAASGDAGEKRVVCTLKDAVKLAPLWPRQGPSLWYVSQQIFVDSGRPAVNALVDALLDIHHRQP
jgi:tetraacyldisaccharide 4'-kinase